METIVVVNQDESIPVLRNGLRIRHSMSANHLSLNKQKDIFLC